MQKRAAAGRAAAKESYDDAVRSQKVPCHVTIPEAHITVAEEEAAMASFR